MGKFDAVLTIYDVNQSQNTIVNIYVNVILSTGSVCIQAI